MHVSSLCFRCFIRMLLIFYLDISKVDLSVACCKWLYTHVSITCFECFICLQTYVANVSSACFKNRSDVAHAAMTSVAGGQQPTVRLRLLPRTACLAFSSPLPSLPSLPSILSWWMSGRRSSKRGRAGKRRRRGRRELARVQALAMPFFIWFIEWNGNILSSHSLQAIINTGMMNEIIFIKF
jgi:hypothetical protein